MQCCVPAFILLLKPTLNLIHLYFAGGTGPAMTGPRPGLQGGFSTAAGSITNMLGIPQQQMMAAAAAATAAGLSPVVMVSNMNEQVCR